jgi:plasmid stabilization system protein ParE
MTRFVVTARAGIDVREILERLSDLAGPSVAERYARDLRAIYERLMMFPASGARRSSLGPFARIAVRDPYVVVYDHVGEEVRIIRVLDGRRNITRRLVRH